MTSRFWIPGKICDGSEERECTGWSVCFSLLRGWFNVEKEEYDNGFDKAAKQLEYAFDFMESAFAGGQELMVFITELNTSSPAVAFLQEYSCERYYRYNKELLFRENTRDILERIRQLG